MKTNNYKAFQYRATCIAILELDKETCTLVDKSIAAYNAIRPHSSCDYLTPFEAHQKSGPLKKRWKKYQKPKFEKNAPV